MKLHPLTHIIIAAEFVIFSLFLQMYQGLGVLALWLIFTLYIPKQTETKLTPAFLKILIVAAFFLFIINGVSFDPLGISYSGIIIGLKSLIHISAPVIFVIYLSRMVKSEEIFALLIDLKVPSVVILILFRTIWLVPRFVQRIDEVITAQKLRGMRIETITQRIRGLIPALSPIFSSMLEEISENSLTITSRGFLQPGKKSHLITLRYRLDDMVIVLATTITFLILWL